MNPKQKQEALNRNVDLRLHKMERFLNLPNSPEFEIRNLHTVIEHLLQRIERLERLT